MKLFHISDLHIGKQLKTYNLTQLQNDVFHQIIEKTKEQQPDVLIIAGDVYDKSVPSAEAFDLFDTFLKDFTKTNPKVPVYIIAGNHDDASRLQFGSTFFRDHNIFISTLPPQSNDSFLMKQTLTDAYGNVNFYFLPFTRPSMVRGWLDVKNYQDAIEQLIAREAIDTRQRNVLISHQFYVYGQSRPERSESELNYLSVGGLDCVDTMVVDDFDYVALGHIHRAQKVGKESIRYSGTPIKYSLSEVDHIKGIQVVEMKEKGNITYDFIPLVSSPDIRKVEGTLQEILAQASESNKDDYVYIVLKENIPYNPLDLLRERYSHIVEVQNPWMRAQLHLAEAQQDGKEIDPMETFREFYAQIRDETLEGSKEQLMMDIIDQAQKGDKA